MIRCAACGRRVPNAAPVCPVHGASRPAAPPAEAPPTPFVVPAPNLPAFRVLKTIGQGGFGAVFLAERVSDSQRVAIKVARADNAAAGEALLREADALAAVGVPSVPAVFASGILDDGAAFVVMEFVQAPMLADRLAELGGQMDLEEFGRHALAILTVIEVAHGRELVHCDLKPENVFVDPEFGAKLFDFGLVRRVGASAEGVESTKEEAPAGTPEYMSPEQCEGRTDLDAQSDIYALGVMFYEMLAGAPPFWGNSAEVQQNHRSRRPAALSRRVTVGVALEDAIMRCLAKDPARRFANATELRRALVVGLAAERARRESAPSSAVGGAAGAQVTTAGPPSKAVAPARERRSVALLFFESKSNVAAVREAGSGNGAQLAHTAGAQYVLAFGHEVGDNPTRVAATAGQTFIERGLTKRALVDLASVSVQARPDGTRRYQSPLFTKKDQYPVEADPAGLMLSPSAVEVLPDLSTEPVRNRPGVVVVSRAAPQTTERTITRMGVAPLVGRDDLVRKLLETARKVASDGAPTITTLRGEAGYGKTHLAQMLVQHLEVLPRIRTIFVRAKEVLGGVGEQTTRELLQRILLLPDAPPSDLGRDLLAVKLGAEVAKEVWAGAAVAMGWAPPEHPELRALAAAPGALRSAAARAVGEGLRLLARERPLALVIEDAHFVDETALDAIEYATLTEAASPIWACLVARPSFGRGRTAWAGRAAARDEITLEPLDPTAAAELARRLLAPVESVPASVLARLAGRTQGIPLLLVELVRGLKRDGIVRKSDKGMGWFVATDELERLPDLPLVQWLSSRETESLPPDLLAYARLASVLGGEFGGEEIEGVLQELERAGVAPETQLDASIGLKRLGDSGILTRHRGGRVGFRHELLRESVYQAVGSSERESIHRAAYEYYRRQDRLADAARFPQMAFHASRSGLKVEAGRLYLELAGRARARHAYLDAELLYRNALQNLPEVDVPGHIAAGQGLGLMRFRLGRYYDAIKDFTAALDLTNKVNDRAARVEILLDEAVVLDWTVDFPRSRALSEEAEALVASDPTLATPSVEPRLRMARGRTLLRTERYPEAIVALREAIETAGRLDDEGYEPFTLSLSMLSYAAANIARYEEAEEAVNRCLQVFEEHGDVIGVASALQNRCTVSLLTNNVERLLADLKRVVQIAREYGFSMSECLAVKDLGEVYFVLGRAEEAVPCARRAIEMFRQLLGDSNSRVYNAEALLARTLCYEGDAAGAADVLRRVVAVQTEARANGKTETLLTDGERASLDAVDLVLRGADGAAFDALIARGRTLALPPQDLIEMMEWKGLGALRSGQSPEGIRFLDEALVEADKHARIAVDRIRRQLEQASASSDSSRVARGG